MIVEMKATYCSVFVSYNFTQGSAKKPISKIFLDKSGPGFLHGISHFCH